MFANTSINNEVKFPATFSTFFAAAGPRLWNSLPVQLRYPDISYGRFRRQLKGHLFENDEHGAL